MEQHIHDCYLQAGRIAKQIKDYAREIIKPGVPLIDIARKIDDKVIELGGELGFPVNLSIDEEAAHFTPDSTCERKATGLLKFDVGVVIDGYFADTAFTIDLTEEQKHKKHIECNDEIQEAVIETVQPGIIVKDIGETVQETLKTFNEKNNTDYVVIKGLSGHEIGRNRIHAGLTISNHQNENTTPLNEKAFAIEPFVTTGSGEIKEGKPGGIYIIRSIEQPRDRDTRKLLEHIKKTYKTRPFCARWLERDKQTKIKYCLTILERQGIIYQYPILIEKTKHPVSQKENTFIISNGEAIATTKD